MRRFLSALAAENLAALLAAMLIVCPVAGLRPYRAARRMTVKLTKVGMEACSSLLGVIWAATAFG